MTPIYSKIFHNDDNLTQSEKEHFHIDPIKAINILVLVQEQLRIINERNDEAYHNWAMRMKCNSFFQLLRLNWINFQLIEPTDRQPDILLYYHILLLYGVMAMICYVYPSRSTV